MDALTALSGGEGSAPSTQELAGKLMAALPTPLPKMMAVECDEVGGTEKCANSLARAW